MKKIGKLIVLTLVVIVLIYLFITPKNNYDQELNNSHSEDKIKIVSSLFPWYDLSQAIGGERVQASILLPPGLEAHSYEPTPSDMLKVSQADLFVYTGDYFEPWADRLLNSLNSPPNFLVLGQDLNNLELVDDYDHEDETQLDPHIWLDPILMMKMADRLTAKLVELDPTGAEYYLSNLETYQASLEQLDADFRETLSDCHYHEIIYGGHYAFGYLAKRYNLRYEAAQGFSPDAESTPARLADLVRMLREYEASYLFAAQMENPQLAETLAREAQLEILTLHTVHNLSKEERDNNLSYDNLMRANLNNLKQGLQCR